MHGPCQAMQEKKVQKMRSFQSFKCICIQSVSLRGNNLTVSVADTVETLSRFFCTSKNIAKHFKI